jgi:hypothetical protein
VLPFEAAAARAKAMLEEHRGALERVRLALAADLDELTRTANGCWSWSTITNAVATKLGRPNAFGRISLNDPPKVVERSPPGCARAAREPAPSATASIFRPDRTRCAARSRRTRVTSSWTLTPTTE